jgi:hypothetical protein
MMKIKCWILLLEAAVAQNRGKEPDTESKIRIETAVIALALCVFNRNFFQIPGVEI